MHSGGGGGKEGGRAPLGSGAGNFRRGFGGGGGGGESGEASPDRPAQAFWRRKSGGRAYSYSPCFFFHPPPPFPCRLFLGSLPRSPFLAARAAAAAAAAAACGALEGGGGSFRIDLGRLASVGPSNPRRASEREDRREEGLESVVRHEICKTVRT